MAQKVLFITTRPINPVNSGTKVVLNNYCRGLSQFFDCELFQYSFYDDVNDISINQPSFIKSFNILEQPNMLEKIYNIIIYSLILRKWPLQVSLFYKRSNLNLLNNFINNENPDIIICDMIRTAEYGSRMKFDKIKVLEMQDLLSKRYKRQIQHLENTDEAFGAYSDKLPKLVKKAVCNTRIISKIFKLESYLLDKYEKKNTEIYNHIIFVSKEEANELNRTSNSDKAFSITMGVDYEYFAEEIKVKYCKNIIGFIGNMNVAHNKQAVNNIIKYILPELNSGEEKFVLKIIGKCSEEYKEQYKNNTSIEVTGEVDDLRREVKSCLCIVAPLSYGSGIKTKVLESMAMGIPVITNKIGVEGIDAIDKEIVYICDEYREYTKYILELHKDSTLRRKIGNNAKEYMKNNFSWNENLKEFKRIFIV